MSSTSETINTLADCLREAREQRDRAEGECRRLKRELDFHGETDPHPALAGVRKERDDAVLALDKEQDARARAESKVAELETCYANAGHTIQRQSDELQAYRTCDASGQIEDLARRSEQDRQELIDQIGALRTEKEADRDLLRSRRAELDRVRAERDDANATVERQASEIESLRSTNGCSTRCAAVGAWKETCNGLREKLAGMTADRDEKAAQLHAATLSLTGARGLIQILHDRQAKAVTVLGSAPLGPDDIDAAIAILSGVPRLSEAATSASGDAIMRARDERHLAEARGGQ